MKKACKDCPERQFYARRFDMHFSGADCWFECEYADDDPKNDAEAKAMSNEKKVLCPWCGAEMKLEGDAQHGAFSYECRKCGASAPWGSYTKEGALEKALRRYKPLQKPLTLEEACGSEEPCVYLEIHPNQHLKPSIQAVDVCFASDPEAAFDCEIHQIGRINPALIISTMYNKVWRCWAMKPTDEERRAAGWEL